MLARTFAYRFFRGALASLAIALVAACGDTSTEPTNDDPGPTPVASIQISMDARELPVGRTRQLSAVLRARDGRELTGRTIAWSSSDARIATVDVGGVVTTKAAGSVIITAESEGRSASASLTVLAPSVATIRLAPAVMQLEVGAAQHLVVELLDDAGQVLTGRPVQFRSDDATIASVEPSGRVVALKSGVTHVTVTAEAQSARARVEISGPVDPRMAGTWQVVIEDVVGQGVKCTVEGITFTVTQDGELLGGTVQGVNGGPRVSCEVVGGQPPYTTPFAPTGPLSGRITRDQDGAVVTLQSANGWSFSGLMRGGVFAGLAAYDAQTEGGVDSRRGAIYAVQLNQR